MVCGGEEGRGRKAEGAPSQVFAVTVVGFFRVSSGQMIFQFFPASFLPIVLSRVKILHTKPRFLFCFPSPFLPKTFLSSFPRYFRQERHGNKKHHNNWAFLVLVLLRGVLLVVADLLRVLVFCCVFFPAITLVLQMGFMYFTQERVGRGGTCCAPNRASSAPAAHSALECVVITEVVFPDVIVHVGLVPLAVAGDASEMFIASVTAFTEMLLLRKDAFQSTALPVTTLV